MKPGHDELYKEAAFVGISLVPVWFVISQFTTAMHISDKHKAWIDIALAGSIFHLLAEESGLNTYYLTNSYASKKAFSAKFKDEHNVDDGLGWIHDIGGLFGLEITLRDGGK
jgi:hypothetical protein